MPEDPASLLIDRLAGKKGIKTSHRLELDLRRPAGVVRTRARRTRNFSTSTEIRNFLRGLSIFGANDQPPILRCTAVVSSLAVHRVLDETKEAEYEPTLTDRANVDRGTHGLYDSLGTTPEMSEIVGGLVLVKARDHSGNVYRFKEVNCGVSTAHRRLSRVELNCRRLERGLVENVEPDSSCTPFEIHKVNLLARTGCHGSCFTTGHR